MYSYKAGCTCQFCDVEQRAHKVRICFCPYHLHRTYNDCKTITKKWLHVCDANYIKTSTQIYIWKMKHSTKLNTYVNKIQMHYRYKNGKNKRNENKNRSTLSHCIHSERPCVHAQVFVYERERERETMTQCVILFKMQNI